MIAKESCIFSFHPVKYFHSVYLDGNSSSTFHLTVTIFMYFSNFFQSIFSLWVPICWYYIMYSVLNIKSDIYSTYYLKFWFLSTHSVTMIATLSSSRILFPCFLLFISKKIPI